MKEYKYILLDLDGTITDPMIGITRCVEYVPGFLSFHGRTSQRGYRKVPGTFCRYRYL